MDARLPGNTAIGGWKIEHFTAHLRVFPKGRICRDLDCTTYLSIYNESCFCTRHEPPRTH